MTFESDSMDNMFVVRRKHYQIDSSSANCSCHSTTVPGFVMTDYKSQSRTMERVVLGLYGPWQKGW
jgi:hypothetical protein